ncbi:MAG: hypothetical protein DRI37_03865 [Chloroflexi bacterium]|nr:MAG: hypothetical protein DRI37_03865 [Chloroflexota bacterium]
MDKKISRLLRLVLLAMLVLSLLACEFLSPHPAVPPTATQEAIQEATSLPETRPTPTVEEPTPTQPSLPPTPTLEVEVPEIDHNAGFSGLYKAISINLPADGFYDSSYVLPVALNSLTNEDAFTFNADQAALLGENGFVVTPGDWLEFFQLYESTRYQDLPVFVTTDSVYHVYHLLFDKLLRDLERDSLAPTLETLTNALVSAAEAQYHEAQGTSLEESARRVWGYFVVAQQLIMETPPPVPGPVATEVNAELALIAAHGGIDMSPLLSLPEAFDEGLFCDPNATPEQAEKFYCEDYSQYVPRGHYTRDEQLKRYFRAMMWYGRINLRLKHTRETRLALLMTRIIRQTTVNGVEATELWANIYDPTVFLVGKSDDLSFHEYGPLMDAVYGLSPDLTLLADDDYLNAFIASARQLPPPQINSMWVYIWEDEEEATQGFRFMGQRFVLDAYIFEELIWREVGTFGHERWLPKGLDVFAAMGSAEAYTLLDEMGETDYEHYDEKLVKVQGEISGLELDSWTQNLYWNWLYALQALTAPKDEAYPPFMQTQAWARKDLQTALGSWTELKHDTILYAKQVMAELGGGAPEEPPVRGYVEPNPEAFARLLALTRMTRAGLEERGILSDQTSYRLDELEETLVFLQSVAERELAGGEITAEEYERIKYYGGWLERMTLSAADTVEGSYSNVFNEDEQAALVADVATDPNGYVLEEATGRIDEIYVVVPNGAGGLQIAQGGVFSYYEFRWPMDDRLTDEAWRAQITAGNQPPRPEWTDSFSAP